MNTVVVDVETTGLQWWNHEIVELSILNYDKDLLELTNFGITSKIKPLKPTLIDQTALEVNGFTIEELMKAPTPGQVRSAIISWKENVFGDDKLRVLGHNIPFDKMFLSVFLKDWYDRIFHYHTIDTQVLAYMLKEKGRLPENLSLSLGSLADHFGISNSGLHRSKKDCAVTLEVFKHLQELY